MTVDAMHVQHETARCVVQSCGAHYVMTAVKSNQPNLLIDLAGLDWERPEVRATEHRTANNGHGRIENRSCRVLDLTDHPDKAPLPHRTVAFRIERERRSTKTGKVEHETVHGLTSLPPEQATAELVLALVRGHWSIENRLHHVRDVSYQEDQCRTRTGHLPRNLACLNNLAISIVRVQGRFQFLPQAHRYYARRPHDAVRQLLEQPKSLTRALPATGRRVPSGPRQRTGSSDTPRSPHAQPRQHAPESHRTAPHPSNAARHPLLAVTNEPPGNNPIVLTPNKDHP